jgi:hypothetical protein
MASHPRCTGCGGPWPSATAFAPDSIRQIDTDELPKDLAATPPGDLGLQPGASLTVTLRNGRTGLLQLVGDILACVERAIPTGTAFPLGIGITEKVYGWIP